MKQTKRKGSCLSIITLLLLIQSTTGTSVTNLHITTGFTSSVSGFYKNALSEADKRLENIEISFEVSPAERSLILANSGINDDECYCIPPHLLL